MDIEEIKTIGKQIPYGKQKELITSTGFSAPYISRFFNREFPLTGENAILVKEAKRIIQEEKDKIEKALE